MNPIRLVLISVLALLPFTKAFASCGWKVGADLFVVNTIKNKNLSKEEVSNDLRCLKMLLENRYVALDFNSEVPILNRLDYLISNASPMSNVQLQKNIFNVHKDLNDLHISYSLLKHLRFTGKSNSKVTISETMPAEKIVLREKYIYFRPGQLLDVLSKGQKEFISFVKNNDKNIVLDLRGNGGGDDVFALELVKIVFTSKQHIPSTIKIQIESTLKTIGLINLMKEVGYDAYSKLYESIYPQVKEVNIDNLINFEIEEEVEKLIGERRNNFNAKIFLITDSGCASSCETIVEKVGFHPNALIVGKNTAGALHFSNAMTFQLPNSGIIARIPTLYHRYENDAPEGVGYSPDIESSLVVLNELINLE